MLLLNLIEDLSERLHAFEKKRKRVYPEVGFDKRNFSLKKHATFSINHALSSPTIWYKQQRAVNLTGTK